MPVLDDSFIPSAPRNRLAIKENLQDLVVRRRAGADDFQRPGDLLCVGNWIHFTPVHDPRNTRPQ
jgi:hypothetical protein